MSHEILGNRFISREKPAWHNIAKRIFAENEQISAREAMAEVAGDVDVSARPLYYKSDDGTDVVAGRNVAIVRRPLPDDPHELVLGISSENWVAASYAQLAESLNDLSSIYKVETAGLLKGGGLAFLCFRAEDWDVMGDEMRSYFVANFSLTPGKGHIFLHSPVRVVCWNTNVAAEQSATINLSIPHSTDSLQRMKLAARLVAEFKETKDRAKSVFEAFAGHHISAADADTIFRAAFPQPTMPAKLRMIKNTLTEHEAEEFKRAMTPDLLMGLTQAQEKYDRDIEKAEQLVNECFERLESFEPNKLRGTAWAAYNAVTEIADWREGRGADQSALYGSRAKEKSRAYAAAYELVGLK